MKRWVAISVLALGVVLLVISRLDDSQFPPLPDDSAVLWLLRDRYEATRRHPDSAHPVGNLGLVYEANGFDDRAAACYDRAIDMEPDEWRWRYHRMLQLQQRGDLPATEQALRDIVRLWPIDALPWFYLGETLFKQSRFDEAADAYRHALAGITLPSMAVELPEPSAAPIAAYARFGLARIALKTGQTEAAVEHLQQIMADAPRFGPAYRLLGNHYKQLGNPAADDYLIRAEQLPAYVPPHDRLADVLLPLSCDVTFLLQQISMAQRAGDQARFNWLVERAHGIFPTHPDVLYKMGTMMEGLGRLDDAIRYYQQRLELVGEDDATLKAIGTLLYQLNEPAEALRYIERSRDDTSYEWFYNMGLLLVALDREAEAIGCFEKALALYPQMYETLLQLGHYHMRRDEPDEASAYYGRAIDAKPYDAEGRKAMAVAQARLGHWQASVAQHRWCLRIEPGSHDAAVALAWMLSTVPDDAARDGEQAVQLAQFACRQTDFRNGGYMDVLAAAYAEAGQFDQAVAMAQRVLVSATSSRMTAVAERVERRLSSYRRGQPWREPLEQ